MEHDEDERGEQRPIIRTLAKPPKEYKFGSDFRTFLDRFNLYCGLNHIGDAQKGPLLFTLLDTHSFTIAHNIQINNMHDYDFIVQQLLEKFDSPAGELGNTMRLNGRHQLLNETPMEYLDALTQLARRTHLNIPSQRTKIIEITMENTNDPEVKTKIIKLLTKGHEQEWNPKRTWHAFEHLIKNLQQIRTITDYSKHTELAQQASSLNIVE